MKKALAIFALLVYFTVSTGFVVSLHYCMDRFDSAQLGSSDSQKCKKCGMHKDGGCCRDEVTVVKLQTNHLASVSFVPDFGISLPEAVFSTHFILQTPPAFKSGIGLHPPPILSGQEIYIRNRVFKI